MTVQGVPQQQSPSSDTRVAPYDDLAFKQACIWVKDRFLNRWKHYLIPTPQSLAIGAIFGWMAHQTAQAYLPGVIASHLSAGIADRTSAFCEGIYLPKWFGYYAGKSAGIISSVSFSPYTANQSTPILVGACAGVTSIVMQIAANAFLDFEVAASKKEEEKKPELIVKTTSIKPVLETPPSPRLERRLRKFKSLDRIC